MDQLAFAGDLMELGGQLCEVDHARAVRAAARPDLWRCETRAPPGSGLKARIKKEFTIIGQADFGPTRSELIGQLSMRRGIIVGKALPTGVLRHAARFLAFAVSALIMSSNGSAADLRIPIQSAVAQPETAPSAKSRWQLFEEFLRWKRQQSR
jgi:hypothetical protein